MARADLKYIIGFETNDSDVVMATKRLKQLQDQVKFLKDQQDKNVISAAIMKKGQKQLNDEIARLRSATQKGGQALRDYITQVDKGGKALRRKEIAAQQAGYQVQDFIVQVQGGTNPLVAFSQQASQLAGFFAGPWGAMIGLGIAALSGLAMAFQGAKDEADDFFKTSKEGIEDLKVRIQELRTGLTPRQQEYIEKIATAREKLNKAENEATKIARARIGVMGGGAGGLAQIAASRAQAAADAREEVDKLLEEQAEYNKLLDEERKLESERQEAKRLAQEALKATSDDKDRVSPAEKERIATENYLKSLDIALKRRTEIAGLEGESLLIKQQEYEMQDLLNKLAEKGIDAESFATRQQYHNAVQGLRTAQAEELTRFRILETEKQRLKLQKEAAEGDQAMLARLRAAYEISKGLTEQSQQLTKTVESSFETMFMNMVDGTMSFQDAFKSMASEVIREVYRIAVAKQAAGLLVNAFTNAVVGPVQGPMLPSMDGGGFTGYGSRAGGMDGKGGFLAMLHPNETVIDHTKGQTGGAAVVVNQSFNFQANGDDSVKRIIAQQAPKIAQMTQQQIMDSRRRGGQMKAVFG
jgi:hypothetical protein